jgi:hypothetical protein
VKTTQLIIQSQNRITFARLSNAQHARLISAPVACSLGTAKLLSEGGCLTLYLFAFTFSASLIFLSANFSV